MTAHLHARAGFDLDEFSVHGIDGVEIDEGAAVALVSSDPAFIDVVVALRVTEPAISHRLAHSSEPSRRRGATIKPGRQRFGRDVLLDHGAIPFLKTDIRDDESLSEAVSNFAPVYFYVHINSS